MNAADAILKRAEDALGRTLTESSNAITHLHDIEDTVTPYHKSLLLQDWAAILQKAADDLEECSWELSDVAATVDVTHELDIVDPAQQEKTEVWLQRFLEEITEQPWGEIEAD